MYRILLVFYLVTTTLSILLSAQSTHINHNNSRCNTNLNDDLKYCFYYAKINTQQLIISDEHSNYFVYIKFNNNFNENEAISFQISSIHTVDSIVSESEIINESLFVFSAHNSSHIQLGLSKHVSSLFQTSDHRTTIKFKLFSTNYETEAIEKCYLVIDFIVHDEESGEDQIDFYYETVQYDTIGTNEVEIDLKLVVPDLLCDENGVYHSEYSVTCLKCSLNDEDIQNQNSVHLSINSLDDDILRINFEYFRSLNSIYKDLKFLLEREEDTDSDDQNSSNYFILIVRIYSLNNQLMNESFKNELITKLDRRQKRFSKLNNNKMSKNSSSQDDGVGGGAVIVSKQYQYQNFNILKTAQLAITEETIGLQTKLKIYDHIWVDYQVNASDYVKQRIQLIAPDNPILNITKPFDYEIGGPLHTFQIIFTRRVDKRTSKKEIFFALLIFQYVLIFFPQ
jgi:hypothetical protein